MSIESYDKIISFPDERLESRSDKEMYELFISQLSHPGFGQFSGDELAKKIIDLGGKESSTGDSDSSLFRKRVHDIRASSVLPSDSKWDEKMDEDSDEYDEAFAAIVNARISTKQNESSELREALFVLFDTHNAGYLFDFDDSMNNKITETMLQLLKNLTPKSADE